MSDPGEKISDLPAAASPDLTDYVPIVDDDGALTTEKATLGQIVALAAKYAAAPVFLPAVAPSHDESAGWTRQTTSSFFFHERVFSTGALNAFIEWDFLLPPATYAMTLFMLKGNDHGIYTVSINTEAPSAFGGSADTIDGYDAGSVIGYGAITGIVWPGGLARTRFTMATKNGASGNYYGDVSAVLWSPQ